MRQLLIIFMIIMTAACGSSRPSVSYPDEIAECAATYFESADSEQARACLEPFIAGDTPSPYASFLMADLLDMNGSPAKALPHYFRVIEHAHASGEAQSEAIAAAMGVVAIRDRVEGFNDLYDDLLSKLDNIPGALPGEAWFQLNNLALGLARRMGKDEDAALSVERAGCLVHWNLAGPFGPWIWTQPDPPGKGSSWPASVYLGPGRGQSATRAVDANTCFVSAHNPSLLLGGSTWVRTTIALEQARTVHFRLQTTNGAVVYAGEQELFRRDPRSGWPAQVAWFTATLPAGATDISVLLSTTSATPGFSLALVDDTGRPAFTSHDPSMLPTGEARLASPSSGDKTESLQAISRYARLKKALWWDDIEQAQAIAHGLMGATDDQGPVLLAALAEATAADPSLPGEIAYERARSLDKRALDANPRLWQSRINLADRELGDERTEKAIALLKDGVELTRSEPELHRRLVSLFANQGWVREAAASIRELAGILPTACNTLMWKLSMARQSLDLKSARTLSKQLSACDKLSPTLAEELTRSGDWNGAMKERQRLARRDPRSASLVADVYEAALARGDLEDIVDMAGRVLKQAPSNDSVRIALADALAASGNPKAAAKIIEGGLNMPHGPRPNLTAALASLEKRGLLAEFRVDGLSILNRHIAEKHTYDTAAVFVLDRAVHLIHPDGGMTSLVHTITHLGSDEAVEQYGELNLPHGAVLLTARTIKAGGRILEPEAIAGKPSFSLPDLEPGDFIETEYAVFALPNHMFPGGFDTERFYFQNFETAFHLSEVIVAVPLSFETTADTRGPCPAAIEHITGNYRIHTWRVRGVLPYPAEPLAPDATEFLPSIRVSSKSTWDNVLGRIRDMLADKTRPSRHIAEILEEAVAGVSESDPSGRRRAIYRWVMENIEQTDDVFEQASHIITRQSGSQVRAFMGLMDAAGYVTRLALVKPSGSDESEEVTPNLGDYGVFTVLVPEDGFIDFSLENAPYGYLLPELRDRPVILADSGERMKTDNGVIPSDSQDIEIKLDLLEDGTARGTVKEKLTGLLAAQWRSFIRQTPAVERERRFQEMHISQEIRNARLVSLRFEGVDKPEGPLILEYNLEAPGFVRNVGSGQSFTIPFPITLVKQTGGLPARATPLVLASHIDKKVRATIMLPGNREWDVSYTGKEDVKTKWGSASRWSEAGGKTIEIGYKAKLSVDRIRAGDYAEFLEFAQDLDRLSELEIVSLKR